MDNGQSKEGGGGDSVGVNKTKDPSVTPRPSSGSKPPPPQLVSVQWDQESRHSAFNETYCKYLKYGVMTDVVLSCASGNESIPCHKVILAASSFYFEDMFTNSKVFGRGIGNWGCGMGGTSTIVVKEVSFSGLVNVVRFIYKGEVLLEEKDVAEFLYAAQYLKVKGIVGTEGDKNKDKSLIVKRVQREEGLPHTRHPAMQQPHPQQPRCYMPQADKYKMANPYITGNSSQRQDDRISVTSTSVIPSTSSLPPSNKNKEKELKERRLFLFKDPRRVIEVESKDDANADDKVQKKKPKMERKKYSPGQMEAAVKAVKEDIKKEPEATPTSISDDEPPAAMENVEAIYSFVPPGGPPSVVSNSCFKKPAAKKPSKSK